MHDLAVEQVGDGGKPDMRMRPHVDAVAGVEHRRPEMVEEDERPDHARMPRRQRAMHLEAAEIDRARHDHLLDGVARWRIAEAGSLPGKKLMVPSVDRSQLAFSLSPKARIVALRIDNIEITRSPRGAGERF